MTLVIFKAVAVYYTVGLVYHLLLRKEELHTAPPSFPTVPPKPKQHPTFTGIYNPKSGVAEWS